jgi:predicted O-methyltransferase YrrM
MSHQEFVSFTQPLIKWLKITQPTTILEWGPGYSTIVMLEHAPQAEIFTIEHQKKWFRKWHEILGKYSQVHMYLLDENYNYLSAPFTFGRPFDLVFIDGLNKKRPDCLRIAFQVLNPDGVVLLHDSEREHYWPPIRELYEVVENEYRTVVLKKRNVELGECV